MADEFTAKFKLDISDLKKNIEEANKAIRLSNKTFQSETAGMDKWSKDADGLGAKLKNLYEVVEQQKKILAAYQEQLQRQQNAYEENGRRAEELKAKLLDLSNQGVAKTDEEYQKLQKSLRSVIAEQTANGKAVDDLKEKILSESTAIARTERDIEKYNKTLAEQEKASKSLTNIVQDQEKTLAQLKTDYADVAASQGKNSSAAKEYAKQIENLSKDLKSNREKLQDAEKSADKLDKSIDELGDSAEDTGKKFDGLGDKIASGLKTAITAAAAAVGAATTALISATVSASDYADEMLTMSTVTGISTDALQAYSYAAELVDVSMETLTGSMAKNVKSMANAAKGSEAYAEAYDRLGIAVTDANGNLRDGETVYWEAIDALGQMEEGTERDALAMQLFGKSAQELNPLIEQGSDGIAKLTEEAKEMGAVMSQESLEALGEFNDSIQRLKGGSEAAKNALGMVLLPQLQTLADEGVSLLGQFTRGLNDANGDWAKISEVVGETVGNLAGVILEQVPKLLEVGGSIVSALGSAVLESLPTLVQSGLSIAETLISGIVSSLPNAISIGVQIVESILEGLSQAIPSVAVEVVQIVPQVVEALTDAIPDVIHGAVQFFGAIIKAIPQIVQELKTALPDIVNAILDGLTGAIPELMDGAEKLFAAIVDAIPEIIPEIAEALPKVISTIVETVKSWMPELVDASISLLMAIVDAVPQIIPPLVQAMPIIISGIVDALIGAIPTLLDGAIRLLMGIVNAIPQIVPQIVSQIPIIISAIVDTLVENVPAVVSGAVQLLTGIVSAIPQIVQGIIEAMPQIISAIVSGLLGGVGEVLSAAFTLFSGVRDESSATAEQIRKDNDAIYGFADVLKGVSPTIADYNKLLSDQGNTLGDLDQQTRDVENAITEILRTALKEQRDLRDEDIASIQEYMDELTRLQLEKLQIYRSQQIAELIKLQLESGTISEETAAQYLANTQAALDAANQATEAAYTQRITTIEQKYQAMNQIGSDAYMEELNNAKAAHDEQIAENESYYAQALAILEQSADEWVSEDAEKWAALTEQMSQFNQDTEDGVRNYKRIQKGFSESTEVVKKNYLDALSEMDRQSANAFLSMASEVKAKGGEIDSSTQQIASDMLGAFDNLPKDLDDAGKDALLGMIKGLDAYIPDLEDTSKMSANEIVDTIKEFLGINSPSKVLSEVGENTMLGMIKGIESKLAKVEDTAKSVATSVVNAVKSFTDALFPVGQMMAEGLWQGFADQEYALTQRVRSMMQRIVSAAKSEMQISSPSKVFAEIGKYMADGLGVGFVREMGSVTQDIRNAMPRDIAGNLLAALNGQSAVVPAVAASTSNVTNFTQNIYAPREPSRLELYRQTRNLLAYATGGV